MARQIEKKYHFSKLPQKDQLHLINIGIEEGGNQTSSCDDLHGCLALAFAGYLAELAEYCLDVIEVPWVVGACVIGVSAQYGYNCYECHESFSCN